MSKPPVPAAVNVTSVLLAAGESRRMGEFKQLLSFEGKTFVEHCVDNLMASLASEVVVVTGHRAADVRRAIGSRRVRLVHNAGYESGMSSSIKCGVAAIGSEAAAVMIALADQPLIGTEIFDHLIRVYQQRRPQVVIPRYGGRNGHPVILDLTLREEIRSLDPEQGLRQLVHAHLAGVVPVDVASEAVLIDFDLPEDYQRLRI